LLALLPLSSTHAAHAAAEHLSKEVIHAAHAAHAATSEVHSRATTAPSAKHVCHLLLLVVFPTSLCGSNRIVSSLNFFEFRFGFSVTMITVRVMFPSKFTKRAFDFTIACVAIDTQYVVGIRRRHHLQMKRLPHINPPIKLNEGFLVIGLFLPEIDALSGLVPCLLTAESLYWGG
jgi:hypothetical protein